MDLKVLMMRKLLSVFSLEKNILWITNSTAKCGAKGTLFYIEETQQQTDTSREIRHIVA